MSVNLSYIAGAGWQFFTNGGVPLNGGYLWIYAAGTTTPVTSYTTNAGTIANTNPIQLDSSGRVANEIWLTGGSLYKFKLTDSTGALIWEKDNIPGVNDSAEFYADLANTSDIAKGDALVGFKQATNNNSGFVVGAEPRTVHDKLIEMVSVKDFGALGDGSGATPNDTGDDISNASWNTWNDTPFKDNLPWSPFGTGGTFVPPRAKPFANDDTWDYIGCNLALWEGARQEQKTYFPAGTYVMNAYSTTPKGPYQGMLVMKGMEQIICGAGPYETFIVWKENAAFFQANNYGTENYYKLLTCYRIGGPPTNIMEMGFSGPPNYDSEGKNITDIYCANINGVTFRDLWLTSCEYGIYADTSSGDSHISRTTAEYCFGAFVFTDATSEISVDFCNFWASTTSIIRQKGVWGLGRISVTNCRSIEFRGGGIIGANGIVSNNYVYTSASNGNSITLTGPGLVSNNQIIGTPAGASIAVVSNVSIIGNYIYNTANHNCLLLGNGTAGSAQHIVIDGNTIIKTDATVQPQNYAIVAPQDNVGYTQAATNTVIISNNTFQGRALPIIGAATMMNNTFDNSIVPGEVNSRGDVSGSLVTTATGGASFTFNVTGIIGQSSGSQRDTRRVTIINVYSNCTGHEVHGVAIYTNDYLGYAQLLGTLGKYEVNGTITFGQSTVYPTVTITNTSGNTANVEVYALPMI